MSEPAPAVVGDTIEHDLIPASVWSASIRDARPCETDSARGIPHSAYLVTDPEGNDDWVCAYDVHPA